MSDETKEQAKELTDATVHVTANDPASEKVEDPAALVKPPDPNTQDSVGNSKASVDVGEQDTVKPIGPRGVNKPRDMKPAPRPTAADVNDVTTKVDSKGDEKGDQAPLGPRGPYAGHVRDSFQPR